MAWLPFDVAADTRHLFRVHWPARQHGIDRRAEVLAVELPAPGTIRPSRRPRVVDLPAIDELPIRPEQEEIRRARRAEDARHVLRLVVQDRERKALFLRPLRGRPGSILRIL